MLLTKQGAISILYPLTTELSPDLRCESPNLTGKCLILTVTLILADLGENFVWMFNMSLRFIKICDVMDFIFARLTTLGTLRLLQTFAGLLLPNFL